MRKKKSPHSQPLTPEEIGKLQGMLQAGVPPVDEEMTPVLAGGWFEPGFKPVFPASRLPIRDGAAEQLSQLAAALPEAVPASQSELPPATIPADAGVDQLRRIFLKPPLSEPSTERPRPVTHLNNLLGYVKKLVAAATLLALLWFAFSSARLGKLVRAYWFGSHTAVNAAPKQPEAVRRDVQALEMTELHEDFSSGFGAWDGRGDLAKQWFYDASGFVRLGPLALYRPSLALSDYRLEFLATVERRSIGWVFRATDRQNYYAMKITIGDADGAPAAMLVRYAVIGGKKGPSVWSRIPGRLQESTPYQVRLDVRGANFETFLNGSVVDSWSDDRLKSGGVGFFCETGESAHLLRVRVSRPPDTVARSHDHGTGSNESID